VNGCRWHSTRKKVPGLPASTPVWLSSPVACKGFTYSTSLPSPYGRWPPLPLPQCAQLCRRCARLLDRSSLREYPENRCEALSGHDLDSAMGVEPWNFNPCLVWKALTFRSERCCRLGRPARAVNPVAKQWLTARSPIHPADCMLVLSPSV
jgi:hypothetical protein